MKNLINEISPYIQMYTNDKINWYLWSKEAFNKAMQEDKPVFVSIGHRTCFRCFKMHQETFLDEEIASFINEHFIAIIVDKDERPDIAMLYSQISYQFFQKNGWPLNLVLNAEQQPFFMANYLPRQSFYNTLQSIIYYWNNAKDVLEKIAKSTVTLENNSHISFKWDKSIINETLNSLLENYDEQIGGFFIQPKLPQPHFSLFILTVFKATDNRKALDIGFNTLEKMYFSGIYDHLNDGFYRLSITQDLHSPLLEKTLTDNSLLAICYLHYYWETKHLLFKEIALKLIKFIENNFSQGLLWDNKVFVNINSEDEISYFWTKDELQGILSDDEYHLFKQYFTLVPHYKNHNVYHLYQHQIETPCDKIKVNLIKEKLTAHLQTKATIVKNNIINISHNANFLWLYVLASIILKDESYLSKAQTSLNHLLNYFNQTKNKQIITLDDYAFLINVLIEMFNVTNEEQYLTLAINLSDEMIKTFYDEKNGNFYYTSLQDDCVMRPKVTEDLITISGNSMALHNLIRLKGLTIDLGYNRLIKQSLNALALNIYNRPISYLFLLTSQIIDRYMYLDVLAICENEKQRKTLKDTIYETYNPFAIVNVFNFNQIRNSKYFNDYEINSPFVIYICEHHSCLDPIVDFEEALIILKELLR